MNTSFMDGLALLTGYWLLLLAGISTLFSITWGVCLLMNRTQHKIAETMGGWKVLMEFRHWYHHVREQAK